MALVFHLHLLRATVKNVTTCLLAVRTSVCFGFFGTAIRDHMRIDDVQERTAENLNGGNSISRASRCGNPTNKTDPNTIENRHTFPHT